MARSTVARWLPRIRVLLSHRDYERGGVVSMSCAGHRSWLFLSHRGRLSSSSSSIFYPNGAFVQRRGLVAGRTPFNGFVEIPIEDAATTTAGPAAVAVCNTTWLRENCHCTDCYTSETSQRKIQFHRINDQKAFTVDSITRQHSSQGVDDIIMVRWADGHQSVYSPDWIRRMTTTGGSGGGGGGGRYSSSQPTTEKFHWNGMTMGEAMMEQKCHTSYEALFNDGQTPLKILLSSLLRYGIGFVDGCPGSLEATVIVAEKVSYLQRTFYGKSWEFSNLKMDFKDTAYTNEAIGVHNDGTYFYDPPGLQVFHCLEHDGSGGETVLVDGFHCAELLRSQSPDSFRLLQRTRLAHDFVDDGAQLKNRNKETVLRVDPVTDEMEWIRYNPYDRSAYSTVAQSDLPELYAAISSLARVLEDPSNEYRVKLRPGTVLFMDNWRVLHGRCAFTGTRRLCGCYISRDAWVQEARTRRLL